jgi:adenine-specific DNA-methyltransferase
MTAALSVASQRRLGAFYTPDHLADVIAEWVVHDVEGQILDPSVGEGSLLRATGRRLVAAGVAEAGPLLTGVDLDSSAVKAAAANLSIYGFDARKLIEADFLELRPRDVLGAPFQSVVANPPYVRHHWRTETAKHAAAAAMHDAGVEISAKASSWAHFLVHAVEFVALGGRMAFVLPGAVLQADYATAALRHVCANFGEVRLIRVSSRVFEDVQEDTVVLAAASRGRNSAMPTPEHVDTVASLRAALDAPAPVPVPASQDSVWKLALISARARQVWNEVSGSALLLNDVASLSIGVVTGANEFFIRASDDRLFEITGVREHPIARRSGWLSAAAWRSIDVSALDHQGHATRLAMIDRGARRSIYARAELDRGESLGLHKRSHCAKRNPWYTVVDERVPDAFLHYMRHDEPRIVENDVRALCTNAVHRVWWRSDTRRTAACTWTSLFALGTELLGRQYGGGVLKLEPSDARRLPVVAVGAATERDLVQKIDRLARGGDHRKARQLADAQILKKSLELSATDVNALDDAHRTLASIRKRSTERGPEKTGPQA